MKRRIQKARIKFLSLCPRGKNKLPSIYKEDGAFEVQLLSKDAQEDGELLALVYAPEFRDAEGDIASAEVIKDALYEAAKSGYDLDLRHDGRALKREQAYVAEQFIVQKGDPRFEGLKDYDGNPVDPQGSWAVVIKIDDPQLRKLYREGSWQGVSMAGVAAVSTEKEDQILRAVAEIERTMTHEEISMTKEEILALVKEAVVEATKQEPKPEPEPEATSPVFKGDPTDPVAVKAYRDDLAKHQLSKELGEAKTPEAVDAVLAKLAALSKSDEAPETKVVKKASNQAAASEADEEPEGYVVGLTKAEQQGLEAGRRMAAWANSQRGY